MADKTYTKAEVDALLARATGQSNIDLIAARPYRTITAKDGRVLSYPPAGRLDSVDGHNGPNTLNGEHPDDYYGVGADGVATKNDG